MSRSLEPWERARVLPFPDPRSARRRRALRSHSRTAPPPAWGGRSRRRKRTVPATEKTHKRMRTTRTSGETTGTIPEGRSGIRLQKFLADAGVASRREGERLIQAGRVEVNGRIVSALGVRVEPERDRVRVDGRRV